MLRPIIALACVAAAAASARVALLAPLTNGTHLYGGGYWKSAVAAMAQSCDDFNARDASVVEAYGNCSNATLMLDCEAFDTRGDGSQRPAPLLVLPLLLLLLLLLGSLLGQFLFFFFFGYSSYSSCKVSFSTSDWLPGEEFEKDENH